MQIEMVPWLQNYTVPMDELYTELTLEQIENKPTGPIPVKLDSYAQLFTEQETTDQQETSNVEQSPKALRRKTKKKKGKKIVAKGDAGKGKSTWAKKIAYDWAKGVFTAVSVVFFVSMKLIKPGQSIENIIIDQIPLETFEKGEKILTNLFDTFGKKCLIIFDGLDEHVLGSNADVKKIIEGRKLSTCCILLTSRPHSVEEIEKYFPTCICIQGFSRDHARYFVSNCIQNQGTVQMVLSYSVKNFGLNFSPMLLSFLCILVNSNELDLNKQQVPLSEIYYKLILCVYRKYCERMKKEFKESEFVDVLTRVGKFAWKMWKSGKNWAKRSEVIKEVGGDAFEIGLLIGHKDFRLLGKVKADILITFPHFALQEFLGSFGFLQMLNEGESIYCLWVNDHGQKILHNPCFIQFCLWFTKGCSVWENFKFSEGQNIYESVVSECAKEINFQQLDTFEVGTFFPFLQIPYAKSETSTTVVKFIQAVLSKCDKIKEFYLPLFSHYPTDYLSELVPCFTKHYSG